MEIKQDISNFWNDHPCGVKFAEEQVGKMFAQFSTIETAVRFLRRDRIPVLGRLIPDWLDRALGKVCGWHLYAIATK